MTAAERRSWVIVASLFSALFFIVGSNDTFGIFVTPLAREFGWSRAQVSLLFTGESLALGVSAPLVGWLLDRIDARWVISGGALLSGCCYLAAASVHSFIPMLAIFLLIGVGLAAAAFLPVSVVISNWFENDRGMAMGLAMAGEPIGASILAILVNYAIGYGGWRFGFKAIAVPMFLIVAPLVFVLVRGHPPRDGQTPAEHRETLSGCEVREAIRTRSFWMLMIAWLCWGYSFGGPFTHLVAYLTGLGYSPDRAALAFSVMMGFLAIGYFTIGRAADRAGAKITVAIVFVVTALMQLILLGATHVVLLIIFVVGNGLVIEVAQVILPMVLADSLGLKRFGSLAGLMWFPLCVGVAIGPWVTGKIFDLTGSYTLAFELSAAAALLGAVATLATLPREYEQQPELSKSA
ncbi:MAG TPA: MFS transporter [Candidatus Binataceae bacterium]|nr:MFS transporter [Candidatus Binataceae bacterium]